MDKIVEILSIGNIVNHWEIYASVVKQYNIFADWLVVSGFKKMRQKALFHMVYAH